MASNLFSGLYAYRPRIAEAGKRDRSPLEDWLTECLAQCLSALRSSDPKALSDVLSELSEDPAEAVYNEIEKHGFTVESQKTTAFDGRPDMVFYVGEWPWFVVENKVDHEADLEQISRYCSWRKREEIRLCNRAESRFDLTACALFITSTTPVPKGFNTGEPQLFGATASATRWSRLAKSMLRATSHLMPDSFARRLALSFFDQLKELHMATEFPTSRAMALAELFMEEGVQLADLANGMLARAEEIWDFSSQTTYWARPYYAEGLFYASRWAKDILPTTQDKVITGFWFPEVGSYGASLRENLPDVTISDVPKVFITIGGTRNSETKLMARTTGCPAGWHRDHDEFIAFADFTSFGGDPDSRGDLILTWTQECCLAFKEWSAKQ